MDCLFCKIAEGVIPSSKVYEDDMILAFKDINPQAPVHVLLIPKMHVDSLDAVNSENLPYVTHIFEKIPAIAASLGLDKGYRLISNCGDEGGQTVRHLHFHLIGGKMLSENIL